MRVCWCTTLLCALLQLQMQAILPVTHAAPTFPAEQKPLLDEVPSEEIQTGQLASSSLVSTGQTVLLDDVPYYIPPSPLGSIPLPPNCLKDTSTSSAGGLIPLTVFNCTYPHSTFGDADLEEAVDAYSRLDDVFSFGFLNAIYLQCDGNTPDVSIPASILSKYSIQIVLSGPALLAAGPYFLASNGEAFPSLRLYSDTQGAFSQGIIPQSHVRDETVVSYSELPAAVPGSGVAAVAVPSRLYASRTPDKPLAGLRIAVKDIFDIKGVRTSGGSRAWYHLYPAANETSPAVEALINAGAWVVGKAKTAQFANGELATADWVDEHAPFNPRGDGYLQPYSSSTGPAVGVAAYDWLDLALGSDTGGSIRFPSQANGVYGLRPSHGSVSLAGVIPLAPQLDTAGLMARDPALWEDASRVLYPEISFSWPEFPREIQVMTWEEDDDDDSNTKSDSLVSDFFAELASHLNATITALNVPKEWSASHPPHLSSNLSTVLEDAYTTIIGTEQSRLVCDPFFADYAAAHGGRRQPYVNPSPRARWGYADGLPLNHDLSEGLANKTAFQTWLLDENILPDSNTSCSERILVYVEPLTSSGAGPKYRDAYRAPPTMPSGYAAGMLSVFAGVPDMVLPIGENGYLSDVTGVEEQMPVSVDLVAAKGCDGMLFRLVQELVRAGLLRRVKAGQSVVSGGGILP